MAWGMALSGGALLGAAHLGVARALREWGIWPDVLAGTSAGGLVAGVLAGGGRLEELTAFGAEVCRSPLRYLRPRVPGLLAELLPDDPLPPADSLLDPAPFVEGLVALCAGATKVRDWRQPTALTAVDLVQMEAVAFLRPPERGLVAPRGRWRTERDADLALALQATMAMPGVFAPARPPGARLVDGGVADTLPVDWAVALGAHRVLAVDVAPPRPGMPERAGITWVLSQSFAFAETTLSRLRRPAGTPVLTLAPDTSRVPPFGFADYGRLVEAGYAEAARRRDEVLAFVAGAPAAAG